MPASPSAELDIVIGALNVASNLLNLVQKQLPPGPPDFPSATTQLNSIIAKTQAMQSTATAILANGGAPTGT